MDTVFPSKIFNVKFNSQVILRNSGAFTAQALIIFFPVSYKKKQELRFQWLCSPNIKIALTRNVSLYLVFTLSLSLSRDRGLIVFLDRNGRKKFQHKQRRQEIICRF